MKTTVHNVKTVSEPLTAPLYIGRGSFWGNPYAIGIDGTREQVVELYRRRLWKRKDMMQRLPELEGKQLLCFCAPEACHGHVLVKALAWVEAEQAKSFALEAQAEPEGQPCRPVKIVAGIELGAIPI